MSAYQHKRGLVNNLPAEGLPGEIFVATDVQELYGGQGSSLPLLRFGLKRYEIAAKSYALASGLGITFEKTNNLGQLLTPKNVEIASVSLYFSASEIGTDTTCQIDFGISNGCGHNADYTTLFAPQFQVWADVENSRAYKSGVYGNLNTAANVLELTGLTPNQGIWINLSF